MPPVWLFVIAGLVLLAMGVLSVGRWFKDSLDARERSRIVAEADAAAAKEDADLIAGITGVLDPLGIFV